jgi:S-adenosylmethionine synthetase
MQSVRLSQLVSLSNASELRRSQFSRLNLIEEVFDLRPAAIIRDLDLLRPIYSATSAYGHFGRELPQFAWERTDGALALTNAVKG